MDSLIISLDPRYPGGVITLQRALAAAHRGLGLRPHLCFARLGRDRWNPSLITEEGPLPTLSTGYLPAIEYLNYSWPALRLRRRLRRFPVVHVVSGVHSAALLPILARKPFVSWVATPFADEIAGLRAGERPTLSIRLNHGLRGLNQRLERWTFRHPRFVFALSGYTARRLAEVAGVEPERVAVLPCPVDLAHFRPEGPRRDHGPRRYILSVGRVDDPRKNVPALIRAYAPVAAEAPDLDLLVVGQALEKDNVVTRLVAELGLSTRVHLPGHLDADALAAAYRGAVAFASTSRQEGLGIAVMEAQASGLPAIVMRCGGSDELVAADGADRDGWLVDQGALSDFTRALRAVAGDPGLRARLGAAARRRALRDYTFDLFTARLRDVYRRVFPGVV